MNTLLKNVFRIALISLLWTGCDDKFLDITPQSNITEANYYKTQQHAIETITACYDPLKHPAFFNINFFALFESFSDEAVHEQAKLEHFIIDASDDMVRMLYTYLYKGVYRCNMAFEKIPPIQMDENLKKRLLGEAYYLRAFYNFYLTVLYNQPPLVLSVPKDIKIQLPNTPRAEFYKQIIADLEKAIDALPEKSQYPLTDMGRATRGAARALLGKTYLYKASYSPDADIRNDLTKAEKYFLDVVNSGEYALSLPRINDSLNYVFAYLCNFSSLDLSTPAGSYKSENNIESLFEVQFHHGGWEKWEGGWQADGSLTSLYFGPNSYRNLVPTLKFVNEFETLSSHPAGLHRDPRLYATVYQTGDTIVYTDPSRMTPEPWKDKVHTNSNITQGYGWKKYFYPAHVGPDGFHNDPNNLRIIRYADVLLMLAETELLLGNEPAARGYLNQVRSRAGLPAKSSVTKDDIIHERWVELGFEWSRWFDLVRWSIREPKWITNIETILDGFKAGKNEFLPIPIREIDLMGGKLLQNPGW